MARILHYDRGDSTGKRGSVNVAAIRAALSGLEVKIENCSLSRDAEDRFSAPSFLYDAVIVNNSADKASDMVIYAQLALEQAELPNNRLVVLCQGKTPDAELVAAGVICKPATAGNGYLLPQEARDVAAYLRQTFGAISMGRAETGVAYTSNAAGK